jgi:hypothetical protein
MHFIDVSTLEKIIELKKKYGHLWLNGNEQYLKSNRRTEIIKIYQGTQKAKEVNRKYLESEKFAKTRERYLEKNAEKIKVRKHNHYLKNIDRCRESNHRRYLKRKSQASAFAS